MQSEIVSPGVFRMRRAADRNWQIHCKLKWFKYDDSAGGN